MATTMDYAAYDRAYAAELHARFESRTPARVFDCHFHLSPNEMAPLPQSFTFDRCIKDTEAIIGKNRIKGGLLMGNPQMFETKEALDEERRYTCEVAAERDGFVTGLLVVPWDNPNEIEDWLRKYPKIVALKPYRCWSQVVDSFEADILDYAPEWMWELAEKWNLCVIIHLSHYGDMLKDPRNGEQIRYLCKKYPNSTMVLAHCAMGHHPDKYLSGLKYLEGLDNVWIDCSGVSEALSIYYTLKHIDLKKIMYGTDGWSFGQALGRVAAYGGNFLGLHTAANLNNLPQDYRYQPLTNTCECHLAFLAAGDIYGLTNEQWEDVFYNNAADLYYSKIRK
ncbi:MAG: amidohydrolase family protein [Clostridia bacterium]|nr:amidohydrolase family protein [Clostridia bacterium]